MIEVNFYLVKKVREPLSAKTAATAAVAKFLYVLRTLLGVTKHLKKNTRIKKFLFFFSLYHFLCNFHPFIPACI